MKNTILKFSLFTLTLAAAFFSWLAVEQAINNPEASVWMAPTIWFSLFFIIFSLSAVSIKEKHLLALEVFLALTISLIFAVSFWHLIIVILGFLFISLAVGKIKKDLELNIRIDLWKTLHAGRTIIIFSLSLIIASQYYFSIRDSGAEKLIPKFKMEGLSSSLTSKVLSSIYPEFKNLGEDDLTVDQLLLETQKKQLEQKGGMENIQNKISDINQNVILEQGRKQISQMTGAEITGQERVADLFSETINNKINSFVVPNLGDNKNFSILPIVMAIFLFLTVISLGSFLSSLWILLVKAIFIILVKIGVVSIARIQKEVEVIQ